MDETGQSPEVFNPAAAEAEARAELWTNAMTAEDVPAFAGEGGVSPDGAAGEVAPAGNEAEAEATNKTEAGDEYDDGVADAAALINYGLNAAAREVGVELTVQRIKGFDPTGSEDPIGDLFLALGIDQPAEKQDLREEAVAARAGEEAFRDEMSAPKSRKRSKEGAIKAIKDMKELIAEVEGADPAYQELRDEARAAGKGYFEYAVMGHERRGLTELFSELGARKERGENDGAETTVGGESDAPGEPNISREKDEAGSN